MASSGDRFEKSGGATNLIINYLPQTLTDDEFQSMFLSIGQLNSSKIVRDRATGYSYGFGFVDYVRSQDAQRAIQTLNGLQLQNKHIKVAYSRSGESVKGSNLYVCNIPQQMTQAELEEAFGRHGSIVQSRILCDKSSGKSKGVGFVLFSSRDEAQAAMDALSGTVLSGGTDPVSIKFAEDNKGKARPPIVIVKQQPSFVNGGGGGNFGGGQGLYGPGPGPSGSYGPMRSQNRGYNQRYNPMGVNQVQSAPVVTGEDGGYVLFVYNIGPHADERELWQLFSPFGTVQKVNVIRDHQKDQGKGYGFVTMSHYHDGLSAIQSLNGYRYAGKPLQVSFKIPKA